MVISGLNPDDMLCVGYTYISPAYWSEVSLSTDGGLTWHHDTLDSAARALTAAFDLHDARRIYLAGDSASSQPYLCVTTDLGETWQRLGTGLAGSIQRLVQSPSDPGLFFCATTAGLYKSTNAGLNWIRKGTMTNVRAVALVPDDPQRLYCGTQTGVFVSSDCGETWQPFNLGLAVSDISSLGLRPGLEPLLFAGTNGGSVYRTQLATAVAEEHAKVLQEGFLLRPNPCSGAALLTRQGRDPVRIAVRDALGRQVWSQKLCGQTLSLPRLGVGVYFVRLERGPCSIARKLVVN